MFQFVIATDHKIDHSYENKHFGRDLKKDRELKKLQWTIDIGS